MNGAGGWVGGKHIQSIARTSSKEIFCCYILCFHLHHHPQWLIKTEIKKNHPQGHAACVFAHYSWSMNKDAQTTVSKCYRGWHVTQTGYLLNTSGQHKPSGQSGMKGWYNSFPILSHLMEDSSKERDSSSVLNASSTLRSVPGKSIVHSLSWLHGKLGLQAERIPVPSWCHPAVDMGSLEMAKQNGVEAPRLGSLGSGSGFITHYAA